MLVCSLVNNKKENLKPQDLHILFFIFVVICLAVHNDNFSVIDFLWTRTENWREET